MILEDLYSLAPQFMFTEDRATSSIYGTYKGFGMMLKGNEQNNCFIFTTWARKGALSNNSVEQWFSEYTAKPENNFIRATDVNNYTIAAVIAADDSSAGTITRLTMFIYDITSFLTSNYYSNACAQCGSAIGLSIGNDSDGVRTQLCKMCTENEADEAAQNTVNQQPLINDQPQQAMFGANGFAEPVQPQQNNMGMGMGAVGVGTMGAVGMMGAAPQNSGGAMGAIDPATAPESTGFTTAADLAALEPPSAASFTNNYSSTPLPNDFRADPAYSGGPVGVTPIARNPVKENINSNPFMGFIGAVLFALIACVIWVLFGMMGRISYIGGLAMGFCTVTGYKLLGKKFDVFGIISCIVVIALAVLGSNLFIVTTTLFQQSGIEESLAYLGYNGFADVFFNFFSLATTLDELLVAAGEKATIMSSFLTDLGIGYLLSGVGFCVVGIPAFKERNY